jgi:hypothetical protein
MLIVAVVAIAALLAAGAFAAITTSNITVPVPVTENSLSGLACTAPGRCVAVGSTGSRYTIRVPFALRSEAGTWTPSAPVPPLDNGDSYFLSIVCASDTRCIAVGGQDKPAPYLGAKSGGGRALVEAFNGNAWRIQQVSTPSGTSDAQLSGVDCVRSTCMAVGSVGDRAGHERVMTQLWQGKSWKMILPPRPRTMEDPTLASVSCVSTTSCIAVGQFTYELGFSSLLAPLILSWDGSQWRFEHPGRIGKPFDTTLGAIDCPTANVCVTVGSQRTGQATYSTFAQVRTRGIWHGSATPSPPRSPDADLLDVACPSVTSCVAVGYAVAGSSPKSLVEWWNGSRWTIGPAPEVPGASASTLSGVRCTSPTSCVAVGNFQHASPTEHAFTATWNGSHWTATVVPDPAGNAST